jgi:hypothetical protein
MKIEIEQTETKNYIWALEDGPEHIDKFSGYCKTLGECFEKIIRHQTINAIGYVYE